MAKSLVVDACARRQASPYDPAGFLSLDGPHLGGMRRRN